MADSDRPTTDVSGAQASQQQQQQPVEEPNSHGQPSDAVPMTDLPHPTTDPGLSTDPPPTTTHDVGSTTTPRPSTTKDTAPSSSNPNNHDGGRDMIEPTTDKGKERAAATEETTATAATTAVAGQPTKTDTSESMAIGPSVEHVQSVQPSDVLVCNITLLLTTGARHPYRIDERYLAKRNVTVPGKTAEGRTDPFTISVYTLKELILREWREEWEPKPASPSSIRLIHFGKLLDDKEPLKQYHFSADAANVVHMTVRPADIIDEEEPKGGSKSASGGGRHRNDGGGCCVIL
ncbi:hypothetical protein ACRALDRAFT_2039591 [Sodiomyces alcalophilus JCM 7366]|uniref:uncharacterized protein n=1 Tax=Sodiomyces alcalophilus JCM 7366 TaxID=591952 RepID=UPI0039B53C02